MQFEVMKIQLLLVGMAVLLSSCATQFKPATSCCSKTVSTRQIREGELFGLNEIVQVGGVTSTYNEHLNQGRLVFARCHGGILVTLPCHGDLIPEALPIPEFGGRSLKDARLSKSFLLSWFSVTEGGERIRKTRVHPIHQ